MHRLHRAWLVAAAGFVALLAAAAIRATFGILMEPLMDEFGWSHGAIATAASINLLVFGLSAPFAAAFTERFGLRKVVVAALSAIALSALALTQATQLWQLYVIWGLVAGVATGAVAPVLAATIAGRWFVARRGLVVGLLTAANSTGQLIFLPAMARIVEHADWRWTMAIVAGAALVALVCVLALLRDRPSDLGLAPYGGEAEAPPAVPRRLAATHVLRMVGRDPVFLALAGSFFICGATTVGLIAVHLIPAAHDHGITAGQAAGLMAAMGVLDIAGTTGSGWLTDRYPRGACCSSTTSAAGSRCSCCPPRFRWRARPSPRSRSSTASTGSPPCRRRSRSSPQRFGREVGLVAFGWVFAAHQIGGGFAAWAAGVVRDSSGTYDGVFVASGLALLHRRAHARGDPGAAAAHRRRGDDLTPRVRPARPRAPRAPRP